MTVQNSNYTYSYHRANCSLSLITMYSLISSIGLFLTFILLLSTNSQFIAFNEFSATGKFPAIFFYIAIVLTVFCFGLLFMSLLAIWSTIDILNKWNFQIMLLLYMFCVGLTVTGIIQLACGVLSIAYMKIMPIPLREYMSDNLRSNYTGGFGVGYLERQYDKSVDWVQINYQCCGVISYEDYRNGFYFNSFNKYTIVNIVPSSCCMYRDPNQPSKCQMKSINIYRKGCYDILIWWMEVFGTLLSVLNLSFGFLNLIAAFICFNILGQIRLFKRKVQEKERMIRANNNNSRYLKKISNFNDSVLSENNTITDSISYIETKT